jgi:DNA-binding transcriptional ArsR family regulator
MSASTPDSLGLDQVIHQPSRLAIVTTLYALDEADFLYLLRETGLTKGNLSAHLSKLEEAEYVIIEKSFQGKIPQTVCRLSDEGRSAFEAYREQMSRALHLDGSMGEAQDGYT